MKEVEVRALLDRYWQAETTLEEERLLAEYFRQPEIAGDLEPLRDLFEWREEEAQLRLGAGFDNRLLRKIAEMESGGAGKSVGRVVPGLSIRWAAAAAIVLCIGISCLIAVTSPRIVQEPKGTAITDTYTDPKQALAAVRHALLLASARINEGKQITQKSITRLHDSWLTATGE
jgi:hypothetical protein